MTTQLFSKHDCPVSIYIEKEKGIWTCWTFPVLFAIHFLNKKQKSPHDNSQEETCMTEVYTELRAGLRERINKKCWNYQGVERMEAVLLGLGFRGWEEGAALLVPRTEAVVVEERGYEGAGKIHPETSLSSSPGSLQCLLLLNPMQAGQQRGLDNMVQRQVSLQGTEHGGRRNWIQKGK